MSVIKTIILVSFFLILFISGKGNAMLQSDKQIRVINKTDHYFTNVMLFSMKFDNLKPNDTSAYRSLNYKPLQDDPLIYCSIDQENYARYLEIPSKNSYQVSYLIDSIQNGILYISTKYNLVK